jgi:glycosyltransferase involved in cell wall biosynthesis/SAM-dependent methyltransferase
MNAPTPLVSIVIPVYNGANYLREAIDSALAQTYPNVEIIVVNDGSTDEGRTAEIARSYGNRIRYIEKTNGGVATALNRGVREMRGEFFSWLSHDDVYYAEKISRQMATFSDTDDDKTILYCNYDVIDQASQIVGRGAIDNFALNNAILSVVGTYVNGCTMLVPKTAFDAAGLFNESLTNSQDNELWVRMIMNGYRLRYVPDILIKSRKHPEQGSLTRSATHAQETRAFYRWALECIGARHRVENAEGLFRILLAKRLPSVALQLLAMLRRDRSLGFALRAMNSGAMGQARPAVARRLGAVPGMSRLLAVLRKRRFRSSSHYWEQRYSVGESSGVGSYGRFAEYKADVLNRFIADHNIGKVADFGCGDGNQLKLLNCPRYLGLDVSPAAVEKCRALYRHDQTKAFLVNTGPEAIAKVHEFGPELTMSLDVLYHLVEDDTFERYLTNLFAVSSRYVVIYSTNFDKRYDFPHQLDRKFADYVAQHMPGWRLLKMLPNPHKGPDTQSDFYIYERTGAA